MPFIVLGLPEITADFIEDLLALVFAFLAALFTGLAESFDALAQDL